MEQSIKERIKQSIGLEVKIYLKNGFRFAGRLTGADDIFIELLDYKSNSYKIIGYGEVSNLDIQAKEQGQGETSSSATSTRAGETRTSPESLSKSVKSSYGVRGSEISAYDPLNNQKGSEKRGDEDGKV